MFYRHLPPRAEQVARGIAYLFTALVGASAVWFPRVDSTPPGLVTTGDLLGPYLGIWAVFMIMAVPAAIATLMARHRIEYVLLPLFTVALAASTVSAWFVTSTTDVTVMARACAASALVCLLVVRWMALNRMNEATLWTPPKRH